jgi:hypothetical protein
MLIANANFSGQLGLSYFQLNDRARKTDFDQEWYMTTGKTLIQTMLISSVLPPILEGGYYMMRVYFRWSDHKGTPEQNEQLAKDPNAKVEKTFCTSTQ